tara:strand:+ start:54 stop:695 length:642 start_codon:yes stop_codon:yes gene_type:complete
MSYKRFTTTPQQDFDFLKMAGLEPHHKLLDIGCGGGRLGYQLINYLNFENYYAFDKEVQWISNFKNSARITGLQKEKNPTILNTDFGWEISDKVKFDYIYAFSVFTHVGPDLVGACLDNLKKHMKPTSKFYATIIEGSQTGFEYNSIHPNRAHEFLQARFDIDYFKNLVKEHGFTANILPEDLLYRQRVGPGTHEDANYSENPIHQLLLLKLS